MANSGTTRQLAPIEKKAVAGPTAGVTAGYIVWLVFTVWPHLKTYVTPDVAAQLPIVIGGILAAIAAYVAPHTHRPDLPPVQPAPAQERVDHQRAYQEWIDRNRGLGGQGGSSSFRSSTGNVVAHGGPPNPIPGSGGGGGTVEPGPTPGGPGEAGGAWPEQP